MVDIKKNVTTARQILDYDLIINDISDYGLFCINLGVMRIIRKLLSERGLYRTTYSLGPTADGYVIPTMVEMVPINRAIAEFLGDYDMSCDVVAGLDRIVDAIESMRLSQETCCAASAASAAGTVVASAFEDTGENYPDGYASRVEYDSTKCNASQWFYNSWKQDIIYLTSIDLVAVTSAGLILALLIPGVDVLAFVGMLVYASALAVATSSMVAINDWMATNESEIVCTVYNAGTATEAITGVQTMVDGSGMTDLAIHLAKFFVTTNAINKAFEKSNVPELSADCSGCVNTCGTLYGQHTSESAVLFEENYWMFLSGTSFGGTEDCPFQVEDLTFSDFTPLAGFDYQVTEDILRHLSEDLRTYSMEGACLNVLQTSCAVPFTYTVNIIECE